MKEDNKAVVIITHILMFVLLVVVGGFTNMFLWNNIISELFDIRLLNFVQAIAVDLVISYFAYQYQKDDRPFIEKYVNTLITTINFLIAGFILTFFI